MILVEGTSQDVTFGGFEAALAEPDTQIRLFGKPEVQGERRMGVALARRASTDEARAEATRMAQSITYRFEDRGG